MSTLPKLIPKEIETIEKNNENGFFSNIIPFFNSKLFLYLDSGNKEEENELNNVREDNKTNENLNEEDEFNFLTNELINELNNGEMFIENKNKINNDIINSLISLAKDGYEFKPKNYKPKNNKYIKKNHHNKNLDYEYKNRFNKYKNNKKNIHWSFNYNNDKVGIV